MIPGLQTGDQWGLGLIHIWELNDIKRPFFCTFVFSLFCTGLFLLAVPAMFTFLQVTLLLAHRMLAPV
jgi:hypothetical protein